ncbi:MAG: hypothetical protein DRI84_03965 [Bacteroidetes bacterium]|nr:MAG: hypothetical protein DRI84_03965 [Bacteroidota bacterium]
MTHTNTCSVFRLALVVFMAVFASNTVDAQGPNNWFFGQKAGIYFNGGSNITFLSNSQMSTPEGCAVYEDSPLSATYYTNGEKIWSANSGTVIQNGINLNGSMNSCQSALFYHTTHSDTVYLFTTDAHNGSNGLCYNIFSRNKKGYMGLQTTNIPLLNSATERMTLANHCDEKSMWLVTHQWNSDAFYSYKINEDSLNPNPIISHVGSVHNGNTLNAKGCVKISPDGTKLALAKMSAGTVELFHFDNIHGGVSDPILITGITNAYGIEFSPTGEIVYVSTVSGQIIQFNLSIWNVSNIINSKYIVTSQAQLLGSLQLSTDNMIYVAKDNSYYLGRIELPNSMGTACIYNPTAVYLNGRKSEAGLPQVYYKKTGYDFKVPIECLGDTSFFTILGDTTRLDSVLWYFGHNPILDSSRKFSPYYIFNAFGNYKVKLFLYHCDTVDTLVSYAGIVGPPNANLGPDTSFCSNEVKILDGGHATDYLWDNGSTDTIRMVNSPGIYWVRLSNSCGESYDTIEVLNIFDSPIVILPPDTTICGGDSLVLDAGDDSLVSIWQYNDTARFYTAKVEGIYQLEKIDSNGCRSANDFYLKLDTVPFISLGPDTTICIGYDLLFNGRSQGHYLWQDGSTDTTFKVTDPGIYYVNVRNACGEVNDSCEVFYEDCNQIIWVPNAFTPNNDGVNDVFLPFIEHVENYHLFIFNRWGELIFETQDYYKGWDGRYNGKNASQDTYIWRIDYTNYSGDNFNQYGYVILFR